MFAVQMLVLRAALAAPAAPAPPAVAEPAAETPAAEPAAAEAPAAAETPAAESSEESEGSEASAPSPPVASSPPPAPARSLEEQWADAGPEAVVEDAMERRSLGDFEGADARLAWARSVADGPFVRYQQALSLEFQERYGEAQAAYAEVAAGWPDAPVAKDARFRRALCLEDLGRHRDALQLVKRLQREGGWTDRDRITLDIARGVTLLRDGRARRGVRRVQRSLDEAGDLESLTWMRAKAHTALARYLLAEAAAVEQRSDRKAGRNLQERATLISDAERQVIAAAQLGEAEYALEGLLLLGDAYLAFHDDLLAVGPPRGLTPEQVGIYEEALREKVGVLKRKAHRYYDEGVAVAVRTRWQGAIALQLKERRDGIDL